jgi:hypothetical protein
VVGGGGKIAERREDTLLCDCYVSESWLPVEPVSVGLLRPIQTDFWTWRTRRCIRPEVWSSRCAWWHGRVAVLLVMRRLLSAACWARFPCLLSPQRFGVLAYGERKSLPTCTGCYTLQAALAECLILCL